jgi:hypothetical protein
MVAWLALVDDPQLPRSRVDAARQLLCIVADSRGRTPVTAGPTGSAERSGDDGMSARWRWRCKRRGVLVPPDIEAVAARCCVSGERQTLSLLVEGGGVLGSFFVRLVDKVHAVIAPLVIGGRDALAAAGRRWRMVGPGVLMRSMPSADVLVMGYLLGHDFRKSPQPQSGTCPQNQMARAAWWRATSPAPQAYAGKRPFMFWASSKKLASSGGEAAGLSSGTTHFWGPTSA